MTSTPGHVWALAWLAYPTSVLLLFSALWLLHQFRARGSKHQAHSSRHASTVLVLSVFFLLSFTHAIITSFLPPDSGISASSEDIVVGQTALALVFGVHISQFMKGSTPTRQTLLGPWLLSLFWEVFLGSWALAARPTNHPMLAGDLANLTLAGLKCLVLVLLICLIIPLPRGLGMSYAEDTECRPLVSVEPVAASLQSSHPTGDCFTYGSTDDNHRGRNATAFTLEHRRAATAETCGSAPPCCLDTGGMPRIIDGVATFISYIWPFGIRRLQLRGAGLVLCLLGVACLNVMIPRQIGIVVDACLTSKATAWKSVLVLVCLYFAVSASGLGLVRQWLWTPLRSFANESMICSAYSHMLHLSARFHESKSTPAVSHAITSSNSLSSLAETCLFKLIPALLDISIAVLYLSITLGSVHGLITGSVGITFFLLANRFMQKSNKYSILKKRAIASEVSAEQKGLAMWHDSDAINQMGYEDNRHIDLVAARRACDIHYERFWFASVAIVSAVLLFGSGASCLLAIHRGSVKQATPGQVAMLLTYWLRLSMTLVSLAKNGKSMSDELIDVETFIAIMSTTPTIKNQRKPLKFSKGDVEFNQVCFEYSINVPVLKNINLRMIAGQVIALIGPHGAGKSTLLKLIRRAYDVTGGSIQIDGQDVRSVDLHSLRGRIGVVSQFPVLFDDTIMNNIRYGLITASDQDIYDACKAVGIHQRILLLSKGYDTRVGEYGVKLSSGEVQLIAIARTIVKRPDILFLDGATSALDEQMELQVQASLSRLYQGLTLLIVTNRLSTVMKADHILVMGDGEVLEQGTHEHLLRAAGKYADMASAWAYSSSADSGQGNGTEPSVNQATSCAAAALKAHQVTQEAPSTKEKSRLNPIAPTFTPRGTRLMARAERGTSSSEALSLDGQPRLPSSQTSRQWSDEVTAEEERLKSAEEAPKTSIQTPCEKSQANQGVKERPEPPTDLYSPNDQEASDNVLSLRTVQFKYPRYSRRIQSKSEPSHEPAEISVKQSMSSHEASEHERHSPTPQQRRSSAPVLKHVQNKSRIAKLTKKNHKATEQPGRTEAGQAPPGDCHQPTQGASMNNDQPAVKDSAKQKGHMAVTQPGKGSSLPDDSKGAVPSRGQDHRGGYRGRGSRYHRRQRGSRKPLPKVTAPPADVHA